MERGAFHRSAIERRFGKFVLARLIVDDKDPAARSPEWAKLLHDRFDTEAIPLYAAFAPDGRVLGSIVYQGGSMDTFSDDLAKWLDEMLAKAGK